MDKFALDGHKLYWHLDRVSAWQKNRVIAPIYVEISPVSFCNHKCIFCGIDFARDSGIKLEKDVLCDRLVEMGRAGVRSVMFAGEGEPLLHKALPEFIRVSHESGMDVSLTTNGSLGNYDIWKDVLPRLTWIRFSVDAGTPEVHARVHNVAEHNFARTIESIEKAVEVKKIYALPVTIGVQFLIIYENFDDIENAMRLFSGLGVDYVSLKPYSLHPQMLAKKEIVYTEEMIRHIDETIDKYLNTSDMNIIFRKEALQKYIHKVQMFKHCCALPFWGYISSKGDFYTCSVFIDDKRFTTGNIYVNNTDYILFGEKRQQSIHYGKDSLIVKDECRLNCRMARINEFLEILEEKPAHVNFI